MYNTYQAMSTFEGQKQREQPRDRAGTSHLIRRGTCCYRLVGKRENNSRNLSVATTVSGVGGREQQTLSSQQFLKLSSSFLTTKIKFAKVTTAPLLALRERVSIKLSCSYSKSLLDS